MLSTLVRVLVWWSSATCTSIGHNNSVIRLLTGSISTYAGWLASRIECKTSAHTTDRGWLMSNTPDWPLLNLTMTDGEARLARRASRTSASGEDKLLTLSTTAFAFGMTINSRMRN